MRSSTLLSALLLVACNKPADSAAPAPSTPAAETKTTEASKQAAPTPNPHADPHGGDPHADPHGGDPHAGMQQGAAAAAPAPTGPASAGGLTWDAPAPLVRRAPKSSMRVAEYGLDSAPEAELTVFYFGADQGGTVEANMARWIGQFSQADGSETKAKRSEKKYNGIEVSLVEAKGVYSGGMTMPGAPTPGKQTDAMLLGAIAKGPEGSVFFKFVGPRDKLEGARAGFEGLLKSLKKTGGK